LVAITSDVVEDFVRVHLPSHVDGDLEFLGLSDFSTWLIDSEHIARFAVTDEGDRQLRREAAALSVLPGRLPVQVPQIEVVATSSIGHLAVTYRRLLGVSGEELRPSGSARERVGNHIAEFLVALHAVPVNAIDADLPVHIVDYDARLAGVAAYASVIADHAPDALTPGVLAYVNGEVTVPAPTSERCLCHADLKGEHVLLHPMGLTVSGVIDWADVAVDDPAVDLGSLAIWLGPDFVRRVAYRYGAEPALVERGLFRIRTWMLTGFGRMLAGENSWPPKLVRTQLRWAFDGE
jgi:aminoglycoside phosphotransferase (APT) family kinase protein